MSLFNNDIYSRMDSESDRQLQIGVWLYLTESRLPLKHKMAGLSITID